MNTLKKILNTSTDTAVANFNPIDGSTTSQNTTNDSNNNVGRPSTSPINFKTMPFKINKGNVETVKDNKPRIDLNVEEETQSYHINDKDLPPYLCQPHNDLIEKFRYIQKQEDLRLRDATIHPETSKWKLGCSADISNNKRNRYANIMTYERNRVKLNVIDGNDYINASYVKVNIPEQSERAGLYIATQGPTLATYNQFWQMCFDKCPGKDIVIVMVTPLTEGYREKCYPYWPSQEGEEWHIPQKQSTKQGDFSEFKYGLDIKCLSVFTPSAASHNLPFTYTKMNLTISNQPPSNRHTKTIHHIYFDKWRDMSSPDEFEPILELSKFANGLNIQNNPIVVHCSAGVGRTGTFIALDHLVNFTKDFDVDLPDFVRDYTHDLIEQIVSQLRIQRLKMVQLLDQYTFIYNAAREIYIKHVLQESRKRYRRIREENN
ncbi:tyrosine protein phosphatase PTP1 SCDLUD_003007 [Saccharomycodes ludwigii]|uniref:tyrosine protein phosphatase PTP1 n=1 Tax=Saccharomycodes ludwigii TaxID=36035 RepID=UPI001E8C80D0|nr:hypothetical protein SCDLUD_003007 [Saccharomycodes ludwigii]KAH3901511.1 hypothetical protein SCDLUD_003007 [Saccharomycodes ludwigii]